MAKKKKPSLTAHIMAGMSYASGGFLLLCVLSQYVSPQAVPYAALFGLLFPFALAGTVAVALLTLLFAPRRAWICGAALLLCGPTIRAYFPVNAPSVQPKKSIHIVSYNILGWGAHTDPHPADGYNNPVAHYLKDKNADIVCLQESNCYTSYYNKYIQPTLKAYKHVDAQNFDKSALSLYSKYPIAKSQIVCSQLGNAAVAYWLRLPNNDTLLVVNTHLTSYRFTNNETDSISAHVSRNYAWQMAKKVANVSKQRAAMADSIHAFLQCHLQQNVIVCGDFNDTPVSYAYNKVSDGLKDAFVRTGNGLGRSYRLHSLVVRIDHMLCSKNIRPYACQIDNTITASDHYPIEAYFKLPEK